MTSVYIHTYRYIYIHIHRQISKHTDRQTDMHTEIQSANIQPERLDDIQKYSQQKIILTGRQTSILGNRHICIGRQARGQIDRLEKKIKRSRKRQKTY